MKVLSTSSFIYCMLVSVTLSSPVSGSRDLGLGPRKRSLTREGSLFCMKKSSVHTFDQHFLISTLILNDMDVLSLFYFYFCTLNIQGLLFSLFLFYVRVERNPLFTRFLLLRILPFLNYKRRPYIKPGNYVVHSTLLI